MGIELCPGLNVIWKRYLYRDLHYHLSRTLDSMLRLGEVVEQSEL